MAPTQETRSQMMSTMPMNDTDQDLSHRFPLLRVPPGR